MKQSLKPLVLDTRRQIQRTSGVLFVVQLFGALGAGFFTVIQMLFGKEHILGAVEQVNEPILWFLFFWGTDFFMIAMCTVLCYRIAGLPGLAPGLALSVYFAHFAGGQGIAGEAVYFNFFATPLQSAGGVNIGYMSYFLMALFCALLIKLLFGGWHRLKLSLGRSLDGVVRRRLRLKMSGKELLDQVDLIVLVLLIPVCCAALTFVCVRYGIQKPAAAFAGWVQAPLRTLSEGAIVPAALIIGAMVGFDITGPVSMAAFGAAAAACAAGDARLLTIYGVCFVTVGWAPLFMVLLSKIHKKVKTDADEFNLASSGPINAAFENLKLTVAFSMPFAIRSPLAVIPGLMTGCAVSGGLTALFGVVNESYLTEPPRFGAGHTMAELLARGEIYLSFSLPLRTGDWWKVRIPLALIILVGAVCGGAVMYALRVLQVKGQKRRGTYAEPDGDVVLELREAARRMAASHGNASEG